MQKFNDHERVYEGSHKLGRRCKVNCCEIRKALTETEKHPHWPYSHHLGKLTVNEAMWIRFSEMPVTSTSAEDTNKVPLQLKIRDLSAARQPRDSH
jgi:hypothetical protein